MKLSSAVTLVSALIGVYLSSFYGYLLFHGIAEIFSIVIAFGIFMVVWNARRFLQNQYLLFLGVAYLFVGGVDLLHTFAFKGMGIFHGFDANLPTQLWIVARYTEAFSLLLATMFFHRQLNPGRVIVGYALVIGLVLVSIFYWKIFPDCFIEGVGLTPFKIISEYIICAVLLASVVLLLRNAGEFEKRVLAFLVASILTAVVQEIAFTTYLSVYGFSNLLGHLLKIVSFYFLYKAIIETSLVHPYDLLFRKLKHGEEELRKSRDDLDLRVRERTQELLEANQALVEKAAIIDLAHDAIIVCDSENRIILWNRGAQETYGFTAEQALGRVSPELLRTVFPEPFENVVKAIAGKGEWTGELRHTRADGRAIITESRWAGDKEVAVGGFIEINRDITPRKLAEERFRRADRAFRTLSECNQAMVRQTEEMQLLQQVCRIVVDVGGYRMAWVGIPEYDENKTIRPIVRAGQDRGYLDRVVITWGDDEKGRGPTGVAIRTGKIEVSKNSMANPSFAPWREEAAQRGFASSIALPLIIEKKVIGALTIYAPEPDAFDEREVSFLNDLAENLAYGISSIRIGIERKRSENELRVYTARLEMINRELQDFAFVASHDLQEPLRKIQTFCDMAIKRCASVLDVTSREYLDRVRASADRMRQLLHDLLLFSRVATRPEPFRKIDLVQTVREAADVFEAAIKQTGCRIELEDMPAVEADESQMTQVFQNLIGNALKYRSEQPPRIRIHAIQDADGVCEIYVRDNGIGFDQQFAERIFRPFQRLHSRGEYEGTGMGLAICRKILERHGGSIRAESRPGEGSTFIIRLPGKQSEPEIIAAGQVI